jgi:hypothetical protein
MSQSGVFTSFGIYDFSPYKNYLLLQHNPQYRGYPINKCGSFELSDAKKKQIVIHKDYAPVPPTKSDVTKVSDKHMLPIVLIPSMYLDWMTTNIKSKL